MQSRKSESIKVPLWMKSRDSSLVVAMPMLRISSCIAQLPREFAGYTHFAEQFQDVLCRTCRTVFFGYKPRVGVVRKIVSKACVPKICVGRNSKLTQSRFGIKAQYHSTALKLLKQARQVPSVVRYFQDLLQMS